MLSFYASKKDGIPQNNRLNQKVSIKLTNYSVTKKNSYSYRFSLYI